jgi:hypothetical protein
MAIKVHFMIGLLSWHAQQVSRGPRNKFDQDQLSAFAVRHGRPAPVELRVKLAAPRRRDDRSDRLCVPPKRGGQLGHLFAS